MSARNNPGAFDTNVRQLRDLYLRSDELDADALRAQVLEHLRPPWSDPGIGDMDPGGLWTWFRLKRAADGDVPHAEIVLHVVDGALKLTNAVPGGPGGEFDHATYNRVVMDFHDRVATLAARDERVHLTVTAASRALADWIGEDAVEALAQFSATANRLSAAGHPSDERRWLEFLHLALPYATPGFVDAVRQALVTDGWSEDAANDLAAQAELVDAYERLGRDSFRRSA